MDRTKDNNNWSLPTEWTTGQKRCVLITTGSMNPVHKGHVHMLEQAKAHLETQGWTVCKGLISPSHDHYLMGTGKPFLSSSVRLELINLATEHHPWIASASWEARQNGFVDFPSVVKALRETVCQTASDIHIWYVCGQDHARYCDGIFVHPNEGLVVVPRVESDARLPHLIGNVIYLEPTDDPRALISSTKVRSAIAQEDVETLNSLLHPSVWAFIRDVGLYSR